MAIRVCRRARPDHLLPSTQARSAALPPSIARVYSPHTVIAALSGPGGAILRLFDTASGALLLEKHLHAPTAGRLEAPDRGAAVAFVDVDGHARPDLLVLTNGHELRRLTGDGALVWAWTASDQTSVP
jgi:hypothetical protein